MGSTTSHDGVRELVASPCSTGEGAISTLGQLLSWLLLVYLLFLIARWITDLVLVLGRSFRPTGPLLVIFEAVYTVTDPPLRFIRRILPPLRVGSVQLDLGYLVLFLVIFVLRSYAQRL